LLKLNNFTVGLFLTIASLLIYVSDFQFFYLLELKSYDLKVRSRGERPVSGEVVIAAIDEKSLDVEGRWPWPRSHQGRLVNRLVEAEAKVIGYDIFFPEKDTSISIATVKQALNQKEDVSRKTLSHWLESAGGSDQKFVEAIRASERTVVAYIIYPSENESGEKVDSVGNPVLDVLKPSSFLNFPGDENLNEYTSLRSIESLEISLPEFIQASQATGYAHYIQDKDGAIRKAPMVMRLQNILVPPLSLHILKQALKSKLEVNLSTLGVENLQLGDIQIPTTSAGDLLVNYYGPAHTFQHISATDILSGKVDKDQLKNKIVLVGGTAAGTHDNYPTPYSPSFPEVEIIASVIESILSKDFLTRPAWITTLDLSVIIISGLLFSIGFLRYRLQTMVVFLLVGLSGYLLVDFYLFYKKGIWLNTTYPVFTQGFVFFGIAIYSLYFEEKQKRFIQKAFAKYLSPVMVDELIKCPELLKSGGEERNMTVIFQDLENFTPLSEKLPPPDLAKFMNAYFTEMTQIILDENGTINQYAGDLIMASFGAPIPTEDHSHRAVSAAVKMHRRILEMGAEINSRDLPPLGCRTGINTGKMFFGNLGSQQVFYYSVMGDSVNTAARLETANKFYDTRLIISESTFENLQPDFFRVRILDVVKVKGKSKSVKIFEVYGDTSHPITSEELNYYETYQRAYMAYLARDFSTARKEFILAQSHRPDDKASLGMVQRIDNLDSTQLSQDWDGSVDLKAK